MTRRPGLDLRVLLALALAGAPGASGWPGAAEVFARAAPAPRAAAPAELSAGDVRLADALLAGQGVALRLAAGPESAGGPVPRSRGAARRWTAPVALASDASRVRAVRRSHLAFSAALAIARAGLLSDRSTAPPAPAR